MNCPLPPPKSRDVGIANSRGRTSVLAPNGCMIVHNSVRVAIVNAENSGKPLGSVPNPVEGAHGALPDPLAGEEGLLPHPKTAPTPLSAFSPSFFPMKKSCQQSIRRSGHLIYSKISDGLRLFSADSRKS